jgi:peptidoglycan/xylan/chitin deacetylase (PgdA/CDA1 family)
MSSSLALYRPSILELARGGNFRAIALWINSLLGPYGIYIRTSVSRNGQLNILIDFQQPRRREFYMALRKHLVKFICYRLWTLNCEKIRDVRIIARIAGEPDILWKQSVRIVTPANREQTRSGNQFRNLTRQGIAWIRFQMLRSAMVSRLAIASFLLCYWLLYMELAGKHSAERSLAAMTSNAIAVEKPVQPPPNAQLPTALALSKDTTPPAPENSIAQLGKSVEEQTAIAVAADQFQGKEVYEVTPTKGEKVVALTFDDGPWEGSTEQVLNILKQNSIKATFFWVGQALQQNPEIAKKVVADGHAIGNHTWQHLMNDVDEMTAATEIGNTARLIYQTTGVRTNLFRPPGGNLTGAMVPYAKGQKDVITMWSVESQDYMVSAPIIVDNVLSKVQPGGIVLLHDGGGDRSETVQALPQIISALKRQGYRFVTIPELLAVQAKDRAIEAPPGKPVTDPSTFNPGATQPTPPASPTTPTEASPANPIPTTTGEAGNSVTSPPASGITPPTPEVSSPSPGTASPISPAIPSGEGETNPSQAIPNPAPAVDQTPTAIGEKGALPSTAALPSVATSANDFHSDAPDRLQQTLAEGEH